MDPLTATPITNISSHKPMRLILAGQDERAVGDVVVTWEGLVKTDVFIANSFRIVCPLMSNQLDFEYCYTSIG
jgi:hypothetical protein